MGGEEAMRDTETCIYSSQFQQFLPACFMVMVPSWAILILGAEHLQAITCCTRMESQKLAREGEMGANHQPPFAGP